MFELEYSQLTGKKRLLRNNCIVHEEKSLRKMLHHSIRIGSHELTFTQQDNGYFDLRIDNESFSFVYNKIKMGENFVYEAGEN